MISEYNKGTSNLTKDELDEKIIKFRKVLDKKITMADELLVDKERYGELKMKLSNYKQHNKDILIESGIISKEIE